VRTTSNSYLLIFRDTTPGVYEAMSTAQRERCLADWNGWHDELAAAGKLDHGHPLEMHGRTVSGAAGERVVDGPFAEAKEAIGGYFLLTVDDLDEATAIARRCPNLKNGMTVEVRPVGQVCDVAKSLGRESMRA
jgi:hypothetical protein